MPEFDMATNLLPFERMSVQEKLQVMEDIWINPSRNADETPSPAWHGDVLAQRQAAVDAGEDYFEDWEIAKEKNKKTNLFFSIPRKPSDSSFAKQAPHELSGLAHE